jgi:hypothetical protein
VAFEPVADGGDGGEVSAEGGVAGLAGGDFETGHDPGRFEAEDAGEFGGVELRVGGSETAGQRVEVVRFHGDE